MRKHGKSPPIGDRFPHTPNKQSDEHGSRSTFSKPLEAVQPSTPSNLGTEMQEEFVDEYRTNKERARDRIDQEVIGNAEALRRVNLQKSFWAINLFKEAGEASGSFHYIRPLTTIPAHGDGTNKERANEEASRRARGKIRRYCATNGLNRLGTLTYKGEGCDDPKQVRAHIGEFFKEIRKSQPRDLPYLWVPEWHKSHGLHVHFAVGRYIKRSTIEQAWPHGFVHIKILGDLPTGSQVLEQSRLASRYLSKYVAKNFADSGDLGGLHRYDLAQGFQPLSQRIRAQSRFEAIQRAIDVMGKPYSYMWDSNDENNWNRPPAVYLSW